jgi:hypothetical protein
MPDQTDYVSRIQQFGWPELRQLWNQITNGHTPGWPPGRAMEYLVLRAFELDGAHVRWPFTVDLEEETVEQIDGAVYVENLACLVEVKDSRAAVDIGVLAKLRTQLARRPAAALGLVVSRSGFTAAAMRLGGFFAPQTVLLMRGAELSQALQKESIAALLLARYRECVERGLSQDLTWRSSER